MAHLKTIAEGIGGAAIIAGTIILSPLLRAWYSKWGATAEEAQAGLAGDKLVPQPKSVITCAVTIATPAARVWPWLAQLGCRRGGWYSFDLLDNGGQPSADRILSEHQRLAVGDKVLLTPDGKLGYPVIALEAKKSLVLGGTLNTRTGEGVAPGAPLPPAYYSGINVFVLKPAGNGRTRLIFRQRLGWNPGFANTLMYRVFLEPISFVMARRMLNGIKQRAERAR
jgi:proline iminopeptidase